MIELMMKNKVPRVKLSTSLYFMYNIDKCPSYISLPFGRIEGSI